VVLRLHLGLGDVAAPEVALDVVQDRDEAVAATIWRSATYEVPGREYVCGVLNSESGVGFDGAAVQYVVFVVLYCALNWVTRLASNAALPAGVP